MDAASSILVQLNLETRAFHGSADEGWRALMTPGVTKQQYIEQLARVYGFEGPLEAALAYTPHLDLVVDVHERYRAGFIAQDLIALGMRPSEVARMPQAQIAPFASPLEALGWMYMADRWSPILDEVRRYLNVRLPQSKDALVYLGAAEGRSPARMQSLAHAIDSAVRSPRMADEVITGAHAAFRLWQEWCERRQSRGVSAS